MEKFEKLASGWMMAIHVIIILSFNTLFIISFFVGSLIFTISTFIIASSSMIYSVCRFRAVVNQLIDDRRGWQLAATYDSLTGALNRGIFIQRLVKEVHRSQRYGEPMSFIMFDIDHFKHVNDTYGHTAGDRALIKIARQIKQSIRSIDSIGRLGGEEFGILLPNTGIESATHTAERLRKEIESLSFDEFNITISLGVTSLKDDDNIDKIYERADVALFESKDGGRNKTSMR
jgi:diguanylate cyclase (GGDEF)-like protein